MSQRISDTDISEALDRFVAACGGMRRAGLLDGGYDTSYAYGSVKIVRSDPGSSGEWNVTDYGTKRETYDALNAACLGIREFTRCHRAELLRMLAEQWRDCDTAVHEERNCQPHYIGDERRAESIRHAAHEGGKLHGMALALRAVYGDSAYEQMYQDAMKLRSTSQNAK